MSIKTCSEELFEEFCTTNEILFKKIPESVMQKVKTPDYEVTIAGRNFVFEIKQLDEDVRRSDGSWSLTPGELVRTVITKKNCQVKSWADRGYPTVLLIFNNFDRNFQTLGTSTLDFTTAMYGELTLLIEKGGKKIVDSFHGKNSKCQLNSNTSFSAIGAIYKRGVDVEVEIYENKYAKVPIEYDSLPGCINAHRIQLTTE